MSEQKYEKLKTHITELEKRLKESKNTINRLMESEKHYSSFFDNSSEGIWCFEGEPIPINLNEDEIIERIYATGVLVECNDMMARMYGFEKKKDLLGVRLEDLLVRSDKRNIEYLKNFIRNGFRLVDGESYEPDAEGKVHIFLNNLVGVIEKDCLVCAWGTQRDITELRRSEEKIRLLSKLTENSPVAMVTINMDKKISYMNPFFFKLYGYNSEEVLDKPVVILSGEDNPEKHYSDIFNTIKTKGLWRGHDRRKRKDGTIFWASSSVTEVKDEKGNVFCYSETSRDITKHREAEEALRESEKKYRLISENTSDLITLSTFTLNPVFTYVSPSIKNFGYKPEELIGKPCFDFIYPDYKKKLFPLLKKYFSAKAKNLLTGKGIDITENIEIRAKDKFGNWHYMESTANLVNDKILYISRDITERKRMEEALRDSEEKYRGLIENVQDGFFLIQDNLMKLVNPAFASMIGYTVEEVIGKDFRDFIAPEDREMVAERYRRRQGGEDITSKYEFQMLCKDGKTRIDVFMSVGLVTFKGKVASLGTVHNITERKQMEEKLRFERAQLLSIFDSINEIIYIVDPETNEILYVNRALKSSFKKDPVGGICYKEFQGFDSPCKFCTNNIILKEKGKPYQWEYHNPILNRDYLITDKIISWPDGRDVRFELARDITERKQALMKLRRVHKIYCDAIENIEGIPYRLNYIDGKYDFVGDRCEEIIGIPAGELTLKKLNEIVKEVIPTNPDISQDPSDYGKAFFRGEIEKYRADLRIVTPAGKEKWISDCSVPLNDEKTGKVVGSLGIMQDITERKQAEVQIKALTNQIEQFSRISADILTIEDDKELFRKISSAIVEISDFSRVLFYTFKEDFPYRDILGYHGIDKGSIGRLKKIGMPKETYEEIYKKGILLGDQSCYIPHTKKDIIDQKAVDYGKVEYAPGKGHWHREDNLLVALKNKVGNFIGMISLDDSKSGLAPTDETVKPLEMFANHISQILLRRNLLKEIRGSEEKYRTLIETTTDMIWTLDAKGRFVFVNQVAEKVTGYKIKEWIGKNYITGVLPEDISKVDEAYRRAMNGKSQTYEFGAYKKNGEIFYLFVNTSPIYKDNKVIGTVNFGRDITEIKKANDEIRRLKEFNENIVTNAPVGIITIDKEGVIIYENPEMLEILGAEKDKPILGIGKKIQEMPNVIAAGVADLFQDIVSGKKIKDIVFPFTSIYGKEMILSLDGVPLLDSEEKFDGGVFLIQDITEKKRMEEQFFQSEKLRALGEMAGGVAHDFNNVLSAILGRAQLLKRDAKDSEIQHGLEVIEKAALDGASTVKRIQEFTRVRVDKEFGSVNINRIVEDAIQFTRTRWKDEADEKRIEINIVKDLREVPAVKGSSSELREVFTNLIFNSIDAMVEGGDIILRTEKTGDFVKVTVKDTGVGMDKGTQKRIFDPFFTTKGVKGTGLGLSVSYGIVSRHNGEISVRSEPGEGTTVIVKIPIAESVERGKKEKEHIIEEVVKPTKILVVDDEDAARDLLYDMLIMKNHKVLKATNGKEALEIFQREGDIEVVFTDLGMPEISGWEVSERIKKIDPKTVVVMITGWGSQLDSEQMAKCGIDRVVAKPFQVDQVYNLVADCVKLRKQRENE